MTLSQIHRHIGNKEALLASVLAADLQAGSEPARADGIELADLLVALFQLQDPSLRTKLQARIVLDGYDLSSLQKRYPGVELTIELLREHLPDDQAHVRAAVLTTFFAGWQLLGPMYLRVTGAEDTTPEEFSRIVRPLLDAIAIATAPRAD